MGEKISDGAIMEAGDTVESAIRACALFSNHYMEVGMKVDVLPMKTLLEKEGFNIIQKGKRFRVGNYSEYVMKG